MTNSSSNGLAALLDAGSGTAVTESSTLTTHTLVASILTALAGFGAQFGIFVLLRFRLTRIYRPKTYLVAERQRVPIPPKGLIQWILPLFNTPSSVIIDKCGLDAYFFLRYLRMLLKIFVPLALIILPILLPLNRYSGSSENGLNRLGWQNVAPAHTNRLWVHLFLSIVVILWVCYVAYKELRGYIRIRQTYLTSPQHRIRASATTVLVSGIPRKWLTVEALNGLYDVFPGGIRNIWINRNFDELSQKVKMRDKIAKSLEGAETDLIKKCLTKHREAEEKKRKEEGKKKQTKEEKQQNDQRANDAAERIAQGDGISSGDPHQTPHNLQDVLDEIEEEDHRREAPEQPRFKNPIAMVGQGFGAVGHGLGALGQFGRNFVGDVTHGIDGAVKRVDGTVEAANEGYGFTMSDSAFNSPRPQSGAWNEYPTISVTDETSGDQERPTQTIRNSLGGDRPSVEKGRGLRKPHDVAVLDRAPASLPEERPVDGVYDEKARSHESSRSSADSRPKGGLALPEASPDHARPWQFWKRHESVMPFPSPQPHTAEEEEYPLGPMGTAKSPTSAQPDQRIAKSKWAEAFSKMQFWNKGDDEKEETEYPKAFNEEFLNDDDDDEDAAWKKYIEPKDRDTLREPIVHKDWFPRLPLMGKKIDKIHWLRKELARLNVEIEQDQKEPEKFPLMNSAFIQFNHQVAAHMACQSLSHHVPQHMAPRLVEISPSDVIWDNMSIKWWERYVRIAIVIVICVALIILYGIPVVFTGLLSQIGYLADTYKWLAWLADLPNVAISIIQGVLPAVLLSALLTLVPIIFRLLVKQQGVPTGNSLQAGVQVFYFTFLFIQVFFVVTLSSGITSFLSSVANNPASIPEILAQNLPKASNYFFSYMIVQALGNSAGSLLQVMALVKWFLLAPMVDSTPRQKWRRQTRLQNVKWGQFFPPFTNFAVIGLVYSVIAPFIMVFNLITFSLFWVVQRYNILYVYQFTHDTGGLLFPKAINQLFTGLYVMEICLIGLFFLARDTAGNASAYPQGIVMIVCAVFTAIFQYLLNDAFDPLFRYLPITLEDDAVIRDEEFSRAQNAKWEAQHEDDDVDHNLESEAEARERQEDDDERRLREEERQRIKNIRRNSRNSSHNRLPTQHHHDTDMSARTHHESAGSWKDTDRWRKAVNVPIRQPVNAVNAIRRIGQRQRRHSGSEIPEHQHTVESDGPPASGEKKPTAKDVDPQKKTVDIESQRTVGDVLFSGFSDELEDLTPDERDLLVRYAFQHSALRARRPVVWIPRDHLGVSDDEIKRTKRFSTVTYEADEDNREQITGDASEKVEGGVKKTNIWISNEGTALDAKGKVVFRRSPPDFANVDLIEL